MSSTEVINDQMEKMRVELANANQQIGVIMECIEIQEKVLHDIGIISSTTTADRTLPEKEYDLLIKMISHIHNACRRA
jgi:hypothetical protein